MNTLDAQQQLEQHFNKIVQKVQKDIEEALVGNNISKGGYTYTVEEYEENFKYKVRSYRAATEAKPRVDTEFLEVVITSVGLGIHAIPCVRVDYHRNGEGGFYSKREPLNKCLTTKDWKQYTKDYRYDVKEMLVNSYSGVEITDIVTGLTGINRMIESFIG